MLPEFQPVPNTVDHFWTGPKNLAIPPSRLNRSPYDHRPVPADQFGERVLSLRGDEGAKQVSVGRGYDRRGGEANERDGEAGHGSALRGTVRRDSAR